MIITAAYYSYSADTFFYHKTNPAEHSNKTKIKFNRQLYPINSDIFIKSLQTSVSLLQLVSSEAIAKNDRLKPIKKAAAMENKVNPF